MTQRPTTVEFYLPQVGCALAAMMLISMCVLPWFFIQAVEMALIKLHLSPFAITAATMGILLGGLINFPLYQVEREFDPIVLPRGWNPMQGWTPLRPPSADRTIVAVNLGGCVIPTLLAAYEMRYVLEAERQASMGLLLAVLVNVGLCWWLARPVPGVGIALPFFVSPAAAVGMAWLLLPGEAFAGLRAPVAFIAGVSGPLIGADLLNLRRFEKAAVGLISIGGAGTFDGIVLSGILAALLA